MVDDYFTICLFLYKMLKYRRIKGYGQSIYVKFSISIFVTMKLNFANFGDSK